jgi:hypothetical protein
MTKAVLVWSALLIWVGSAQTAVSQSAQDWLGCSTSDANAITLIEEHGDAADVPPERLYGATLVVLEARKACREGRLKDARALYNVVLAIGPVPGQTAQK